MIVGEVHHVANTKILVAPMRRGHQLTVYQNQVNMTNPTAMILPFPYGNKGAKLIDLSSYPQIFDDLSQVFVQFEYLTNSYGSRGVSRGMIAVHQIGSYSVSIVPTINDFERLQNQVFGLDPNLFEMLKGKYPDHAGYIVCLMNQNAKFHPIAYVTRRPQAQQLFVPTYHYHGHVETHPDWDHEIYVFNLVNGQHAISQMSGVKTHHVINAHDWSRIRFDLLPPITTCHSLSRFKINSKYDRNHDLIMEIKS